MPRERHPSHHRALARPARRLALVWGPMVAGAVLLVGQVILILLLGLALGLKSASGFGGFVMVVVYAFVWGMAFAGYAVFTALKTKNAAAAQAATFAFFPLIFLSTTFVPKEYITATWLRWVATINPTTYVFSAMRSLLLDGWRAGPLLVGMAVVAGFATLTGALAVLEARKATQLG